METISRLSLADCIDRRLNCSNAPLKSSTKRHRTSSRCCNKTQSSTNLAPPRQTPLLWLFVLGIAILSQATSSKAQENSTASTIPSNVTEAKSVEVIYDPADTLELNHQECFHWFDNRHQALYICRDNPRMLPLLQYAERIAKDECEKRFSNELWNCSEFSLLKTPKINKRADTYREGAYVDALSFAVITHTIAKACKAGLLEACRCDENPTENSLEENKPCSDNVTFGMMAAEKFLNLRFISYGRDLKHEISQHNFRAANETIKNIVTETPLVCNCHGISGSCTFQTCFSQLPEFEVIGEELKKAYDNACEVRANGRSDNSWISECSRQYTWSDLIYRDSHNWCVADSSIGAPGMVGRRCDPNTSGTGSCQKLCRQCGRDIVSREENRQTQCKCSFVWCCEIHCSTCIEHETVYECA